MVQTTWFVDAAATAPGLGTAGSPYASLQFAIDAAATLPGDTLSVATGVYAENVNLNGKDLIVSGGSAAGLTVIDGQGQGSALSINSGETAACVIRGLTVTGGIGTSVMTNTRGGGAFVDGASPTFENVIFTTNVAFRGGGASVTNGGASFVDCEFTLNQSNGGGGLFVENATVSITDSVFEDNAVDGGSSSGFGGGATFDDGAAATLDGVRFEGNSSFPFGGGGGLYADTGSTVNVIDSDFVDNSPGLFAGPGFGGGIFARGTLTCSASRFTDNGMLEPDGVFGGGGARGGDYTDCQFIHNTGQLGGGLYIGTATDTLFDSNYGCADGGGQGGGAYVSDLINCDLVRNMACGEGGGAFGGDLLDCRVIDNFAEFSSNGQSFGGGLNAADATNTIISRNRCGASAPFAPTSVGGGAFNSDLVGCIVVSNRAGLGGGTVAGSATQTTIVANFGENSAGGTLDGSFDSCIVWHNFPPSGGQGGTFTYSNVEGVLPAGIGNFSTDPQFFTPSGADSHLMSGSVCIDSGSPALPADADGSVADMGALPFDPNWMTGPAGYCQPTLTGNQCRVELEALTSASLGSGLMLRATGGPALAFGLFFTGSQPNFQLVPGTSATRPNTLCVGGTVRRVQVVQSSPSAAPCGAMFDIGVSAAQLLLAGAQAGGSLYGQLWFRDPVGSGGNPGTAMSGAVYLPIIP